MPGSSPGMTSEFAASHFQTRLDIPAARFAPECCIKPFAPLISEGAGNAGCPMHPQPRVQNEKAHEQVHHRFTGKRRHSLRNGFNGLLRALPGEPGLLSPSPRNAKHCRELTPASGRQDHTASPSANSSHALRSGPAATAPCPAFVAIASRPSCWDRMARGHKGDLPDGARGIFGACFREGETLGVVSRCRLVRSRADMPSRHGQFSDNLLRSLRKRCCPLVKSPA
jgi:hypothetical protein